MICRGCRARKIKCILPDTQNLGPLSTPQPKEKACERCRSLGLKCIVDYTLLGRPQSKRTQLAKSEERSPNTQSDSLSNDPANLDIKKYLFADEDDNIIPKDGRSEPARTPRKEEVFQSMIQPHAFFLSVLEKDRLFGSDVAPATTSWDTPLPILISQDMAASFDRCLVWHRFFLPKLPALVSLRERLVLNDPLTSNCATRLLFALLGLSAFDLSENITQEDLPLRETLRQAVSFLGQEFIFSPPTHPDTVVVCLFLSDYKPTAMATTQGVAHKAIKSELYMNIAYGVFHRLESVNQQGNQLADGLNTPDYGEFESWLFDSIHAFQVIAGHATVDGLSGKPLHSLQVLTDYMKSRVDMYQIALTTRPCTPRAIYYIQWATSTCILFETLTSVKQSLHDSSAFIMITEENERKCIEQIHYSNFLLDAISPRDNEEMLAVRSLLKHRFCTVNNWGIALGMLYTSMLGRKIRDGIWDNSSDITPEDTTQIGAEVANTWKSPGDPSNMHFREILVRFGKVYPKQLMELLDMFIECSKMRLNGVIFRPPPRYFGIERVTNAKNLLENNVVMVRSFGYLHSEFPKQLELFKECAERLAKMASSSDRTAEAAFAGGCVYALCSKVISGFLGLMEKLKAEFRSGHKRPDLLEDITTYGAYSIFTDTPSSGQLSDNLDMYGVFPSSGISTSQIEGLQTFDWSSMLNMGDPGFQPQNPTWFGEPFLS
ncbi:hypothetical protein N7478_007273 [Penicillium angulare]|uniref:uncharacterized protein n=1 Tax=Penicillium angulare TaxID=116970 RepID=UPI002540C9A0|nr:uncharacterized protein N7478_007273 [Penicillium angulare]KAJ5281901.1 hypothetical protein N7478_007273 [Penicillium angulare]